MLGRGRHRDRRSIGPGDFEPFKAVMERRRRGILGSLAQLIQGVRFTRESSQVRTL